MLRKKFISRKTAPLESIERTTYDAKRQQLLLSTFKGTIRVYDIKQDKFVSRYRPSEKPILWAMVDPFSQDRLWYSEEDKIFCYDMQKRKNIYSKSFTGTIYHSIIDRTRGQVLFLGSFGSILQLRPSSASKDIKINTIKNGKRSFEKTNYKQIGGGPPVGAPVQIEIRGDEFETSLKIADQLKTALATIDGVYGIRDNWEKGKEEFHVEINETKAAVAGISVAQIARSLQMAFEGRVSTSIKKADEEINIRVVFLKY